MAHGSDDSRGFVCCDKKIYTVNVTQNKYKLFILQTELPLSDHTVHRISHAVLCSYDPQFVTKPLIR